MHALISLFWSICRLQKGPDAVPHSVVLLSVVLLLNGLLALLQFALHDTVPMSFLKTLVILGMSVGFTYALLHLGHLAERFMQTLIALNGANFCINCFIIPFVILQPWLVSWLKTPHVGSLFVSSIVLLCVIGINLWLIVVNAHIYSRALDRPFVVGLLATIALLGLDILVFSQFN